MSEAEEEAYMILLDPAWSPGDRLERRLPIVAGTWPIRPDGSLGRFRSNPEYVPTDPAAPTDPIDAALHGIAGQDGTAEELAVVLRDSLVELALNGDDRPLLVRSPDDVLCVVVASAEPHRRRVAAPRWSRVTLEEVAERLPDDTDLLVNPGGSAAVRLTAGFVRSAAAMTELELTEAYERLSS